MSFHSFASGSGSSPNGSTAPSSSRSPAATLMSGGSQTGSSPGSGSQYTLGPGDDLLSGLPPLDPNFNYNTLFDPSMLPLSPNAFTDATSNGFPESEPRTPTAARPNPSSLSPVTANGELDADNDPANEGKSWSQIATEFAEKQTTTKGPPPIPISSAPHGYTQNVWQAEALKCLSKIRSQLNSPLDSWDDAGLHDGTQIYTKTDPSDRPGLMPCWRGDTYIPNAHPQSVLSAAHLFSYRALWDPRAESAGVLNRFANHTLTFYMVQRGADRLVPKRDFTGIQQGFFTGPDGQPQKECTATTQKVELIYRSCLIPGVGLQEGIIRGWIDYAGVIITRAGDGCNVCYIGKIDVGQSSAAVPGYALRYLLMEQPRGAGRLRSAISHFGWPPYAIDEMDAAVFQVEAFFAEIRRARWRLHLSKPASVIIVYDRRMYPNGAMLCSLSGPGAHAVTVYAGDGSLLVKVEPHGVGLEFVIDIDPVDREPETSSAGWW